MMHRDTSGVVDLEVLGLKAGCESRRGFSFF
jgi:hypothetical protein